MNFIRMMCFVLLMTSIVGEITAQGKTIEKRRVTTIGFAYYADVSDLSPEGLQPGFRVESEIPLFYSAFLKQNSRSGISKTVENSINLVPYLGFYKRAHFHNALTLGAGLSYKITLRTGFILGVNVESGLYKTFLNVPIYEQNSDGSFDEKKRLGFSYLTVGGTGRVGWSFLKSSDIPIEIFTDLGLYFRYPVKDQWIVHLKYQLGIHFTLEKIKEVRRG